ncbi:Predicted arabinose efflux permease, MFS family [Lentzea albidocapillata subsp. violacea]|uniref:Predicted arabinose efflux permease, MFS family n=1 Tax=Lentzea albidocapillata subsp. violacea TaxID=128104 RepID=A0A1G9KEN7_9PSEU|nr:MFS transporter [Lentzea albidocapillata]SDL48072.1 Predicted arabinose efflux permease, MFS family [Lentzea albidocapillata subsp. violacea]
MTLTAPVPSRLWSPERRWPTTGILLLVTLLAFEAMGVGTAMPTMVRELRGEALYAWPFLANLAASVIATVFSGRLSDRRGPKPAVLIGVVLFLAGLVVAGVAETMTVLLAGRALQGFGAGFLIVAVYVLIAVAYPEDTRPAVFGALSAAWVIPSLVGPAVAGWATEHLSWRWVFLAIIPLVLVGSVLLVPVLRGLPRHTEAPPTRRYLPLAAVAVGLGVAGLSWGLQHRTWWLIAVALLLLAPALRILLPKGTLIARRGLPVTILARGLLAGTFFAVEGFIPLTLSVVHGYSPLEAGIPLTLSALGWASASMWASRHPEIERYTLVRIGFLFVATGVAAVTLIAPTWGPAFLTPVLWAVAGAGMGMATSSVGVLMMAASPEADRGFNSAALQISDMLFSATMIGLGGVLVLATAPTSGVVALNLSMAALAVVGAILTGPRMRATLKT